MAGFYAARSRITPPLQWLDLKAPSTDAERHRLALEEGRICFDLFAPFVSNLLHSSERLRRLLATMYPAIILDEFQDTNAEQWQVVQALGVYSRLIALADPEQRIYDFIGADPKRLNHFREAFKQSEIDLSDANHRSAGTDIARFGNDILTGRFQQKPMTVSFATFLSRILIQQ